MFSSTQTPSGSRASLTVTTIGSDGKNRVRRKPAPRYIPSPPGTPPSSPIAPVTQMSVSIGSAMNELPPLPKDWRKTIERALDEAAPVVEDGVASSQEGRVYSVPTIVVGRADEFEEVDLTDLRTNGNEIVETRQVGKSASLPSARMSAAAPRPPTAYRPPTPPLSAGHRTLRKSDSIISTAAMMKHTEMVYPDRAGLGQGDGSRMVTASPDSSEFTYVFTGTNLDRHTLPPSLSSWLTQKAGSLDTSTLVDDDASLPTYYKHKHSSGSTTMVLNQSHSRGVWELMQSWTGSVVQKARDFCAFWSHC